MNKTGPVNDEVLNSCGCHINTLRMRRKIVLMSVTTRPSFALRMDFQVLRTLLPRYFRIVGDASRDLTTVEVSGCAVQRVQWTTDFCAIPGYTPLIDDLDNHKTNGLYPMDVASALAVIVLNPRTDVSVNVLDLCCCPGNKLATIAERLTPESVVIGVDISESRLNVCRSLLRSWSEPLAQYKSKESARQLVFHGDGTQFRTTSPGKLIYDSDVTKEELAMFGGIKKRNKSYIKREQKRLKVVEGSISSQNRPSTGETDTTDDTTEPCLSIDTFDYVLVDAECSHDASYKHMQFIPTSTTEEEGSEEADAPTPSTSKKTFDKRHATLTHDTDPLQLRDLQRALLANGFANLKPGGVLVYSTCSKSAEQNEDIVQWFMDTVQGQAELVPVLDTLRAVLPLADATASTNSLGDNVLSFGTAEFRFDLSDPASPLHLLQKDGAELMHTLNTAYPTPEARRALSVAICGAVTAHTRPVVAESSLLPGTAILSYKGGMSGHFIAKIRKL